MRLTVQPACEVTWSSSNPEAVTVSDSGLMTAIAPGVAEVTATTADDKSATCGVFSVLFGDLNGDNDVNVGDVNTVLSIILSKN